MRYHVKKCQIRDFILLILTESNKLRLDTFDILYWYTVYCDKYSFDKRHFYVIRELYRNIYIYDFYKYMLRQIILCFACTQQITITTITGKWFVGLPRSNLYLIKIDWNDTSFFFKLRLNIVATRKTRTIVYMRFCLYTNP